jgi:hypothetical protein
MNTMAASSLWLRQTTTPCYQLFPCAKNQQTNDSPAVLGAAPDGDGGGIDEANTPNFGMEVALTVYENHRWFPFKGWGKKWLPTDR